MGSAPGGQGEDKGKQPQAMRGEAQVGHQKEFLLGQRGQALEGATQECLESPSLEVSRAFLDVALWAGNKMGFGHRLDSMVWEIFSHLSDYGASVKYVGIAHGSEGKPDHPS